MNSLLTQLNRYGISVLAETKSKYVIGLADDKYILETTQDGITIASVISGTKQKVETLDDVLNYIDNAVINLVREIAAAFASRV